MSRTQQLCDSMLDKASFSMVDAVPRYSGLSNAIKMIFNKKENCTGNFVFPDRDRASRDVNPCLRKIEIEDHDRNTGSDCSTSIWPKMRALYRVFVSKPRTATEALLLAEKATSTVGTPAALVRNIDAELNLNFSCRPGASSALMMSMPTSKQAFYRGNSRTSSQR